MEERAPVDQLRVCGRHNGHPRSFRGYQQLWWSGKACYGIDVWWFTTLYTVFVAFNNMLFMIPFKELDFLKPLENASVCMDVYRFPALLWDNFSKFNEQSL